MQKLFTWIRSKFQHGYSEPSIEEIIQFLKSRYAVPTGTKDERIIHYTPFELQNIVSMYFNVSESQFNEQRKLAYKNKVFAAFEQCGYKRSIVHIRVAIFSKDTVKKIALVVINR